MITLFNSCNSDQPMDISYVEGAWELTSISSDHRIVADYTGKTLYSEEPSHYTNDNKENVWLFYQGHISEWAWSASDKFWDGYACDCVRNYETQTDGNDRYILESGYSIIPLDSNEERRVSHTLYKIEKLTKSEMILKHDNKIYISDIDSTITDHITQTFKRENTLLKFIEKLK